MDNTNAAVLTCLLVIAVHGASTFSDASSYCHRLVPRFITYHITPCRYPCLFVSRHVHPHIVVQNERDGTPCMLPTGFHHEEKIGKCIGCVCTPEFPHKSLKRKKRFICLYTLARILKLRKQRNDLQNKINELRKQLARTGNNDFDDGQGRRRTTSGTDGVGRGISGPNFDEPSGTQSFGDIGSGLRGLGLRESETANGDYPARHGIGFEGTMSRGREIGPPDYFSGANTGRENTRASEAGTSDSESNGQGKIGALESGDVDVN